MVPRIKCGTIATNEHRQRETKKGYPEWIDDPWVYIKAPFYSSWLTNIFLILSHAHDVPERGEHIEHDAEEAQDDKGPKREDTDDTCTMWTWVGKAHDI